VFYYNIINFVCSGHKAAQVTTLSVGPVALHEINSFDVPAIDNCGRCWACCPLVRVQIVTSVEMNFQEQGALLDEDCASLRDVYGR
jgi:hypothetical protein